MSNFVFDGQRNGMLGTGTARDLDTDTIRAILIDHTDDTPVVADANLSDFAGVWVPTTRAACPALASRTIGSVAVGVFDAADTVFTALSGDQCESLVLFKDSGADATSPLVCRWDTATGLPVTPNGADLTVVWASGGILTV